MPTHILMNVIDSQELRVAVIADGRLQTLLHERPKDDGHQLGNVYKARVANVEPALDAAFIDLGNNSKHGFLHVADIRMPDGGRSEGRRIEQLLKAGDEIVVQITKEAIREKGPVVSGWISLPGRHLVLLQTAEGTGVSRRIEDPAQRARLKALLPSLTVPDGFGYIVRTEAAQAIDDEIRLDAEFLGRLWAEIAAKAQALRAPACLYQEADAVLRTLRDLAPGGVEAVIIDNADLYDEARAFVQVLMPELASRIRLHREELPLFTYYGVEARLASVYERSVQLPSGGNIVIEQTEAMVSIDVNSSRNTGGSDVHQTALMTNLEAVSAIAEQLILRDLGGLIIIDFIDMEKREHQRLVQLSLRRALLHDKARTQVALMSRFGLVELTRQRTRPSHKLLSSAECPHCQGTGRIRTAESFEIDCLRAIREALGRQSLTRLEVVVPREMTVALLNGRRKELAALEDQYDCRIVFVGDDLMKSRDFRLVPTAAKRQRQSRERDDAKPVTPALLATAFEERARALAEAKALANRSAADLERELEAAEADPASLQAKPAAPAVPPAVTGAVPSTVAPQALELPPWVAESLELRRLLFSPNAPIRVEAKVAAAVRPLAPAHDLAKQLRPAAKGRGRRHRR